MDTCLTYESLNHVIVCYYFKFLFDLRNYVKCYLFWKKLGCYFTFPNTRFILHICLREKKSKKPKMHKSVKGFYCTSHLPVMTFFSALSLALPSCRRLQLRQPRWHVAPCPSRGWFFLHRKTQIQSQKTLGLPFCLYGVRLQSHQGRLGSATKYNIIRNTDIKRFLTTS